MEPLGIPGNEVENNQMENQLTTPVLVSENPKLKEDEVENNQMENQLTTPVLVSENPKLKEDEFWPLSGKPYFTIVLSKSQVINGLMHLPNKISKILPSSSNPVTLTYCGKNWDMTYISDQTHQRSRFNYSGWKTFVHDNDLEEGDACVFEVMESSSGIVRFRVQILRGDFPPELEERNGNTSSTPIVLD